MTEKENIIEEVLKEHEQAVIDGKFSSFEEAHKSLINNTIQKRDEEVLKLIDDKLENPTQADISFGIPHVLEELKQKIKEEK